MTRLEPLRVQCRYTIRRDGRVSEERLALCPARGQWTSLGSCKACNDCAHVSIGREPLVLCSVSTRSSANGAGTVRAALSSAVWCLEASAPARLVSAMASTQADAMVVDDDGHVIGLLPRDRGLAAGEHVTAGAEIDPMVVALLDSAPLERARELFATHGIRTLPVLSAGRVIGCVSVDDASG